MILTVTLNPALDISYPLEKLELDTTNRVDNESKTAGGKGLNVGRVANLLGANVLTTGYIGGEIGEFILARLGDEGIQHDFYKANAESRICIAMLHEGQQTEILESGPIISKVEETGFLTHFSDLLATKNIKIVTISGSLPQGVSTSIYVEMLEIAKRFEIPVILDSSGAALANSLQAKVKPFAIKPNETEISQLLEQNIKTEEEIMTALDEPLFQGIPWVIVSLGAQGALARVNNDFYRVTVPKIEAVSPVGSGDSTVAGLAMALAAGKNSEEIIKTAMTAGILNTLEKRTGFINTDNFTKYYDLVQVTKLT